MDTDIPEQPAVASPRTGLVVMRSDLGRLILGALAQGERTQTELRAWLLLGSGTALNHHLAELRRLGLIVRRPSGRPRGQVDYALSAAGAALVEVIALVDLWLARHPDRRRELRGPLGWRAFVVLAEAWELSLLGALARSPRTEADLLATPSAAWDGAEKLHRIVAVLIAAGLLDRRGARARGTKALHLTDWCRVGFGPFAAAVRWEREHLGPAATRVGVGDAATALLAALPSSRPDPFLRGTCTFTIEAPGERARGVWARAEHGGIRGWGEGRPPGAPGAWVHGALPAWFPGIIDGDLAGLRLGGRTPLASSILLGLHHELYVRQAPIGSSTHVYRWDLHDPGH